VGISGAENDEALAQHAHATVTAPTTREDFTSALGALKGSSSFSYQALSVKVGRPVSTVHGWCTGRHLPYPRDNEVFENLLRAFGVANTAEWVAVLAGLRTRSSTAAMVNPYRGLEPFTENDAELYHGRTELTEHLSKLVDQRLASRDAVPLMVIGASGSGKTSLLRAGLHAGLRGQPDVTVSYLTPNTNVDKSIASVLMAASFASSDSASDNKRVIIIDQFEELFASTVSEEDLAAAINMLEHLRRSPRTTIVIGMRADFFHRAATIPLLLEGFQSDPIVVGPMTTDEATDCIVRPAEQAALTVEPKLLVELIDEFAHHVATRGSTEALPLLSHVLYLLAESPDGDELTRARYEEIGGIEHALGRSADGAYGTLTAGECEACQALFGNLVELGTNSLPTRRPARLQQFTEDQRSLEFDTVLAEFASRRLLTVDFETVIISHEALLTAWPLFADWIADERDALVTVRRLRSAAAAWRDADSDPQALLRGPLLETARELLASAARHRLGDDDQQFLEQSLTADAERLIRDAQILARQLSMQATMMRELDPSLSAQIALVAHSTASTIETRSGLLSATSPLPGYRFLGGPGPTALAVSTDGSRAAFSNSVDGTITLLDLAGRPGDASPQTFSRSRLIQCTAPDTEINALALSPDGHLLAAGGSDRAITLVDLDAIGGDPSASDAVAERRPDESCVSMILENEQLTFHGAVMSITFDSTGNQLFAAGKANGVGHWEVGCGPTAQSVGVIPAAGTTMSVAASDNGLLATAALDGTVTLRSFAKPCTPTWATETNVESPASAAALSADGSMLLAGFRDGVVRVWNVLSPTQLEEVVLSSAPFATWVNAVDIANDVPLIAAASSDGHVRCWNTSTWHEVRPDLRHPTVVTSVKFTPGRTLLTTAEDGAARTWTLDDAANGNSNDTIWSLTVDKSGERLTAGSRKSSVVCSVLDDGHIAAGCELPSPQNDLILSGASCISPDGCVFVSGTRQGPLILSRLTERGSPVERLDALEGLIEHVQFSDDGTMFGAVDDTGKAQLWTFDMSGHASRAGTVDVEPPALGIAFSAEGSLLAVSSESGNVHLYDVSNPLAPDPTAVIKAGDSFAISVEFHPLIPVLAAGNADRSVTLWDCRSPATPRLIQRLSGPGGHVMALAFNRSGDRLAAGLTDGNVWIWNTENLETENHESVSVYANVPSGGGGVYALTFSSDGHHLFAAGPHHRIFSWILDEAAARSALRTAVGDPITAEEWSALVPSLPYAPPV